MTGCLGCLPELFPEEGHFAHLATAREDCKKAKQENAQITRELTDALRALDASRDELKEAL